MLVSRNVRFTGSGNSQCAGKHAGLPYYYRQHVVAMTSVGSSVELYSYGLTNGDGMSIVSHHTADEAGRGVVLAVPFVNCIVFSICFMEPPKPAVLAHIISTTNHGKSSFRDL